jgi:hypothetical protein
VSGPNTAEMTARLLAALRALDGVRPWCPVARSGPTALLPWDPGALAIDIADDSVRIRLVARRLPLRPELDEVEAVARRALAGSRWARAGLRLVVSDLDPAALSDSA